MWGSIFLAEGFEARVGLQGPQQLRCKDAQLCRAKTGCHLRQGASPNYVDNNSTKTPFVWYNRLVKAFLQLKRRFVKAV